MKIGDNFPSISQAYLPPPAKKKNPIALKCVDDFGHRLDKKNGCQISVECSVKLWAHNNIFFSAF